MNIARRVGSAIAVAALVLLSANVGGLAFASVPSPTSAEAAVAQPRCALAPSGSCRGASLQGRNLRNAQLARIDLRGADLRSADLRGVNLSRANLHLADLRGANLHGANLVSANLSRARFGKAEPRALPRMRMETLPPGCSSTGGTLNCAGADLSGADLNSANLSNADLSSTNLTNANLTKANLTAANLANANASGSNFTNAVLNGANVATTNLSDAIVAGQEGMVPPTSPQDFAACIKNNCGLAPSAGQLSTSWLPPGANPSSPPVMGYFVSCTDVAKPQQSLGQAGTATAYVFQGLNNLDNYACFAYAVNAIGTGPYSPTSVGQASG